MPVQPAQHGRRFTSRPLTAQHDELVTYCGCGPTGGAPGRFPWKGEMGLVGRGRDWWTHFLPTFPSTLSRSLSNDKEFIQG